MAQKARIDMEFIGAAGKLLRYRVVLTLPADIGDPLAISAQRMPKQTWRPPQRLAFVEGRDAGFEQIVAAPPGTNDEVSLELADRPAQNGVDFVRYVLHVETSVEGGVQLWVKHKLVSQVQAVVAPASMKNTATPAQQVMRRGDFPRLIVGITAAPAVVLSEHEPAEDPGLGKVADLAKLLAHIESRLRTPTPDPKAELRLDPLEPAWRQQGGKTLPRKPKTDGAHVGLAEEAWARQVTEMLLLTPYGGPGVHYFGGGASKEHKMIADGIDGTNTSDPKYAIIYACQHLATFGVASRGRAEHRFWINPTLKAPQLINAGSGSAGTVRKMDGRWIIGGKPPKPFPTAPDQAYTADQLECGDVLQTSEGLYEIRDVEGCEFAAGSVFVFANREAKNEVDLSEGKVTLVVDDIEYTVDAKWPPGTFETPAKWKKKGKLLADNTAGAHAGFVLRTELDAESGKRTWFQTFDTGGMSEGGNRGDGVQVIDGINGFHSGNFDDPPTKRVKGTDPFRGVGVWKKMETKHAKALDDHVESVLKKARPLGFARLVVVDGLVTFKLNNFVQLFDDKRVLYASPLLRMYRDDPLQNYAIARFIWSLRAAPCGLAKVMWWITMPVGPLAHAMVDNPRATKIGALADAAFDAMKDQGAKAKLKDDPARTAKILSKYTLPLLDIEVADGDRVKVIYKYPRIEKWHPLHFAERELADKKVRLPMDREYIRDAQSTASFPAYFREF